MNWHLVFDVFGAASAFAMTVLVYKLRLEKTDKDAVASFGSGYAIVLILGAAVGGFGLGTLNLMITGVPGIGRSIVGALAGTIAGVEIYKWTRGMSGSTGLVFVAGFSTTVVVGRIGCLLSGIEDQTFGIATSVPWAWDFGDGVPRHPVALYESASMAVFLVFALGCFAMRAPFFLQNGFYLMVGFYGTQRFIWEFFKPYGTIIGPLNLFHLICLALIIYAGRMIIRREYH